MQYWASKGVPKSKLLMGIPFYGQTFTLARQAIKQNDARVGAAVVAGGQPGPFTQQSGMLAYYEICSLSMFFFVFFSELYI